MKISNFKFQISNLIFHPLFSGSAIMVIGSNSINLINYLYHLIMGRLLGPANYGELASLISLIGLLGIIPASLSLVIVKYISSENQKDRDNLISFLKSKIWQISLSFSVILIILSPMLSTFLHVSKISYLILIALSSLFSLQSGLNRSILQGLLKFKEMVESILAENTAKLLVSVLFIYLGFRVGGAMLAFVIAASLGFYITNFYLQYHIKKNPKIPTNLKSILTFTLPVLIQSFSTTSLYSSDVILVRHFFSSHEAGIYAALSTLGKIIFFGTGPIGAVMFPLVSQRKARGGNYGKIFIYSLFSTTILAASVLVIYWLVPSIAIRLLYGSAYLEASNLLVWFGVFMMLFTLSSLFIAFNLSMGKTKVVILPMLASIAQIMAIWFFHHSLFQVIFLSILVTALLLGLLFIYSSYGKRVFNGDKAFVSDSASV